MRQSSSCSIDAVDATGQTSPTTAIPSTLDRALTLHKAGQLDQAQTLYQELLQHEPEYPDAQQLLGALLCQRGEYAQALPLLQRACQQMPHHRDARLNLAKAQRSLAQHPNALATVLVWLERHPQDVDALVLQGRCLRTLGRDGEARQAFESALLHAPQSPEAMLQLADLLQTSAPAEAMALYRAVLNHSPNQERALSGLAMLHKARGELEPARQLLERALAVQPERLATHTNLGNVLVELLQLQPALEHYQRALALDPKNSGTQINLGNALRLLGRTEEARAMLLQCLGSGGEISFVCNNLGILESEVCNHKLATAYYCRALEHDPDQADVWANLGSSQLALGERAAARQSYGRALELQSDSSVARFGLANVDLLEGRWAQGWQNYELRWMGSQQAGRRVVRPNLPWPQWLGQAPIPGQSIFVFHEQGFGDTLHFMRFLPLLAQQFGRVVFVCQPSLVRLARASLGHRIEVVSSDQGVVIAQNSRFDWQVPLLSLPLALGVAPPPFGQANAVTGSYLRVPAADPAAPLQVGLCWAGNSEHSADALRSVPLAHFDSLFKLPGVQWHALVHGAGCPDPRLHDALHGAQDFADTAQRVRALDLIISVDTAMAHLAAGMGKPVWLLNRFAPDWRWGFEGEHCVWYPSLRQFRQPAPGQWEPVLQAVEQALCDWQTL
ncbi:MAG: tetratricopeptide repeat protein [Burkholderiales bacterium]|nr:tetratricopeptide repeat protein [Burkholderiales bacterium]